MKRPAYFALTIFICLFGNASDVISAEKQQIVRMQERADLDGDGRKEYIYFACFRLREDSPYSFVLEVAGNLGAFHGDNLEGYFKLVDIDTSDSYLEIAVPEEGPSDDYAVHYFRYCCGEITKLGTLPGYLDGDGSTIIDGSGVIKTMVRGYILDTWFSYREFRYDKYIRDFVQSPINEFVLDRKVALKTDLPLFEEKNMGKIAFTARTGEKGLITKTDDKLWCLFESETGQKGWFPVYFFNILHLNKRGHEVFDGLFLVD